MDKITIQNYRCFRERQTARLAPLTLLVGNNSTGKTSFLALIRALWEVAFLNEAPDFRKEPYDLGTFRDIAHNRGRGGQADSFEAGLEYSSSFPPRNRGDILAFSATFKERGAAPFPVIRSIAKGQEYLELHDRRDGQYTFRVATPRINHEFTYKYPSYLEDYTRLLPIGYLHNDIIQQCQENGNTIANTDNTNLEDVQNLVDELVYLANGFPAGFGTWYGLLPFASAPVRSRPRRTYDSTRPSRDSEGEYIPTYLASLYHRGGPGWDRLKNALEDFGQASGLFDEISINSLGKTEGTPFQVQIRKFGKRLKGPPKNLIDVGYGVSQVLPVITELSRDNSFRPFLLQQPEVHLHPSAQAALGSLFCSIVADTDRQIIVETHSDHLLDRVRMDVRDKRASLKPEDVSILFFERDDLDVNIHSIGLDKEGNILNAPPSYRQFFMAETRRSIGL